MKVLIATYSFSGTTKKVADKLAELLPDSDQFSIDVADETFSPDMFKTAEIAKQQIAGGDYPTLTHPVPDVSQYDLILVGSPVWSGKPATPVHTFLQHLQGFAGKVATFYTDAGNAGDYEKVFRQWAGNLHVVSTHEGAKQLSQWVQQL